MVEYNGNTTKGGKIDILNEQGDNTLSGAINGLEILEAKFHDCKDLNKLMLTMDEINNKCNDFLEKLENEPDDKIRKSYVNRFESWCISFIQQNQLKLYTDFGIYGRNPENLYEEANRIIRINNMISTIKKAAITVFILLNIARLDIYITGILFEKIVYLFTCFMATFAMSSLTIMGYVNSEERKINSSNRERRFKRKYAEQLRKFAFKYKEFNEVANAIGNVEGRINITNLAKEDAFFCQPPSSFKFVFDSHGLRPIAIEPTESTWSQYQMVQDEMIQEIASDQQSPSSSQGPKQTTVVKARRISDEKKKF
jgi:hypothetical protein